jgi:hypothetical protein
MDEFNQTIALLKRGAKWGDIEVYTLEENIEIINTRVAHPQPRNLKRKRVLEEGEIDEDEE